MNKSQGASAPHTRCRYKQKRRPQLRQPLLRYVDYGKTTLSRLDASMLPLLPELTNLQCPLLSQGQLLALNAASYAHLTQPLSVGWTPPLQADLLALCE